MNLYALDLVAAEDYRESDINLLQPLEGAALPHDYELLVRHDPRNSTGLHPGDVVGVQAQNGKERVMQVVGVVGDQSAAGDFMADPRGYVSFDSLAWLGEPDSYNRLFVRVTGAGDDEAVIDQIAAAVEDKVERTGRTIFRTDTNKITEHPMASTAPAVLGVLGALGVVADYGLAGFIADTVGIDLQGFRVVPVAVLIQGAIAFMVPLVAGYFPVKSGSRTTVRRAISNDGLGSQEANTGRLDRLGIWLKWLTRPLLLSIRNTFRRKGRLALTLFTLTMAGAIFIAVFNVRDSLGNFMDQLGQHLMADVTITFDQPYRISQVEQAVSQISGVKTVEGWSGAGGEIVDADDNVLENVQIIAPPAGTELIEPDMLAGRRLQPDEGRGIVLSDSIWSTFPDLQPGDTLRISVQGTRAEEWPVPGIFRFTDMFGDTLGFAIWLAVVLALSVVASMLPARNAARLTIREVLAYE